MAHKIFILLLSTLGISSCLSTYDVYHNLSERPATISYLHTREVTNMEKVDSVRIKKPVITDSTFASKGRVVKTDFHLYPLIVFYDWENIHDIKIGANFIREEEPQFIQESLKTEFNRSTVIFADSSNVSDLTLEVQVDTFRADGLYKQEGSILFVLYFIYWSFYDRIEPLTAHTSMSYQLQRDGEVLLSGETSHQLELDIFNIKSKNRKELAFHLNAVLAEGLSESIRMNIEDITRDVEDYLAF